ncbi:class III lanthionine synthetase LanKC [Kitasatospora nipponensis]|uniref:Class III lanthionine synthetase LanKC n=1 Tax=Kitasatospora nipponensis TaxID=258049 RepID=A0ABN1WNP8_9ACTN
MLDVVGQAFADREYYAPLATIGDRGQRFAASNAPQGWLSSDSDIWTAWSHPEARRAAQGWKIHVSARLDRAQDVLDVVARVCFAERVPFKHVAARTFFLALHHKHADRAQAGKFCAVYPHDTATARRLLDALSAALEGEEGPYVLSDRRYRDSRTVHYRYGAFSHRSRLLPDGSREPLVRDGSGRDVPDLRRPAFVLPEGVTDPFVAEEPAPHTGPIVIRDYEVVRVLQPSNAGGAYQAVDRRTGRVVFLKEARAHNGYSWDGVSAQERLRREYEVLTAVHAAAPGVCPQPLDHFTEWEHDFLVTEFVEGVPLQQWVARTSPLTTSHGPARDPAPHFEGCRQILRGLDDALASLHALGYRFGDLSPANVLVAADLRARLVDFEAATPLTGPPAAMGTAGFTPPREPAGAAADPLLRDRYGMTALALSLLAPPLQGAAQPTAAHLALLRRDLTVTARPPADLWARATAFPRTDGDDAARPATMPARPAPPGPAAPAALPSPADVDADPEGCLAELAVQLATGLLEAADPERSDWVFPPASEAFRTNTVCVAYGTAGVVHALHRAGVPVPEGVEKRLVHDALALREELPPGLTAGSAGIARVLAQLGRLDEAIELLRAAQEHPLTRTCGTLAGGLAGIGLSWLALHRRTRDARHLERAAAAGDTIVRTTDPAPTLGDHDARGLFHGRSGLALFLHRLAGETGQSHYLEAGRRLLHEELDRALRLPDGGLSYADNAVLRRAMPYLAVGSAGVATAVGRYVATSPDERCAAALPLLVADARRTCTLEAGLCTGLAGLAYFLAEHAELTGRPADRETAVRVATGLLKHASPHGQGMRCLGAGGLRYAADLSGGAAGVLLALLRVLHGPQDELFTLDHGIPSAVTAPPPRKGRSA